MIYFTYLSIFLALFYSTLMLYYTWGWLGLKFFKVSHNFVPETTVSIIIPARNEEKKIEVLIQTLLLLNYPKHLLDIVIVDDFSTDNTSALVLKYMNHGIRLLHPDYQENHITFKKQAIDYAISKCQSQLIITTDADCEVHQDWVRTIVAFQKENDACFISSPVAMKKGGTLFQQFQALEFSGLVAIGGAALHWQKPNMCNGANVAYLKTAYTAVGGFKGNEHIPSGDDEFLMHKMFLSFPGRVLFLKNKDVIVNTHATANLIEFIQQRMRWVSKSTKYENRNITRILFLCYCFNLSLLINFIGLFFNSSMLFVFAIQFGLKLIAEGILLYQATTFFVIKKLMRWLLPEQMIHVIYVVMIGVLGNTVSYRWKGRRS